MERDVYLASNARGMSGEENMFKKLAIASTLLMFGSTGIAHADPVGNTSNDQRNAQIICNELAANPTQQGLRLSMNDTYAQMIQQGESAADARDDEVDGTAYALMYTCPQYAYLVPR